MFSSLQVLQFSTMCPVRPMEEGREPVRYIHTGLESILACLDPLAFKGAVMASRDLKTNSIAIKILCGSD